MMDLSQTYMRESDRIESLFTYKMSLMPTNDQVLLRVLQAETGNMLELYLSRSLNEVKEAITTVSANSLLAQSTLLEISLASTRLHCEAHSHRHCQHPGLYMFSFFYYNKQVLQF